MQKKCVRSFLFLWVWAHPLPNKKRKKRSPLSSFFLRFWSSKKKSFRRWDARKEALKEVSRLVFLTFYTITSSSTMAASSLTAAALGSKVAFANKVRLMNNASFRLWLFFLFLVSFRARARCTRKGTREREIIFSVKFYHLSLEKLSSRTNARKRGYKTHSFPTKSARLATWTTIFLCENERLDLDLAFGSRIVDFTSVWGEKERDEWMMMRSRRHTFSRERSDIFVFGSTFHSTPTLCVYYRYQIDHQTDQNHQ